MDEDERYYHDIVHAAKERRDLTSIELQWAKKLELLDFFKNCHWDDNGKVI